MCIPPYNLAIYFLSSFFSPSFDNYGTVAMKILIQFFFFFEWTIFKVFIEFVTILLPNIFVLLSWPRGMWDLVPWPEIKNAFSALEGEVVTTGSPGKSFVQRCCIFLFLLSVFLFP